MTISGNDFVGESSVNLAGLYDMLVTLSQKLDNATAELNLLKRGKVLFLSHKQLYSSQVF